MEAVAKNILTAVLFIAFIFSLSFFLYNLYGLYSFSGNQAEVNVVKNKYNSEEGFYQAIMELPESQREEIFEQAVLLNIEILDTEVLIFNSLDKGIPLTDSEVMELIKSGIRFLKLKNFLNRPDFSIDEKFNLDFMKDPILDNDSSLQNYLFLYKVTSKRIIRKYFDQVIYWTNETYYFFSQKISPLNSQPERASAYLLFRIKTIE